MSHVLVTNDFPPKIGGIQHYLWELWRRLPAERVTVLTTPYAGAVAFDAIAPFPIVRTRDPVLLPLPHLVRRITYVARQQGTDLVILDPGLPIGAIGPALRRAGLRYAVVLHGAEVTMYGRAPVSTRVLRRLLRDAELVIAAGNYPLSEAERCAGIALPHVVIEPGVDIARFHPRSAEEGAVIRHRLGLPRQGSLVVGASRLVPRKGFHRLIAAAERLGPHHRGLTVAIAGSGRERRRLDRLAARATVDVRMLGRLPDGALADLVAAADVFAMPCRDRWRGLEQEGFGIVFVEASASGVAVLAGDSGGVRDAVLHERTGLVVDRPVSTAGVAAALDRMLSDPKQAQRWGTAGRQRAVSLFSYDVLAQRLNDALETIGG